MVKTWGWLCVSVSVLIVALAAWLQFSRPSTRINANEELKLAMDDTANSRFDLAEQRFLSIIALGEPAQLVERARQNLGFMYLDMRRTKLAQSMFEAALAANPSAHDNLFNLAETFAEQGKSEAKPLFMKCVELHPSSHTCLDGLAHLLVADLQHGGTNENWLEVQRVLRELVRHAPEKLYAEKLRIFFSLLLKGVPRKTSEDLPPSSTLVNVDPPIFTFDGFFSAEECEHIISLGASSMPPSTIHQQSTDAVRTSSSLKMRSWAADAVLSTLPSKMSALTGIAPEILRNGLDVQLVRYLSDEQYSLHMDCSPWHFNPLYRRAITLFIYLNTMPGQGGRTAFPFAHFERGKKLVESHYQEENLMRACDDEPSSGVSVQPVQGSSVLWYNYDKDQDPDALTQHVGCPVRDKKLPKQNSEGAVKWGLNVWFTLTPTVIDLLSPK